MDSAETSPLKLVRTWGWLAVILLAHLPLVIVHFDHLWQSGLYAHLPLLVLGTAFLLWSRWEGNRRSGPWRTSVAAILLAGGFLLLLLGALSVSPWLGYVAMLITCGALLLQFCPAPFRQWGPPWMLLWLLVPLPMAFDRHVALELQSYSSWAASLLLDFFHVNHLRSGNTIEVPGMKFFVEDSYGGIHSLYVLIAASAALAVVLRHGWFHMLALIVSAAAWAGVANLTRFVGIVLAASRWSFDLSTGWGYQLWGLALFLFAFGLVLSTDQLLLLLLSPAEEYEGLLRDENDEPLEENSRDDRADLASSAATSPGIFQSWVVAGMFACLGLVQTAPRQIAPQQPVSIAALAISDLGEETLPAELSAWRRIKFEIVSREAGSSEAEFSAVWHFERDGREAIVSLDYPFSSWHHLTHLYRGRGCKVRDWHLEPTASENATLAVASLDLDNARTANLLFVQWDGDGKMLAPPVTEGPSLSRLMTDLKHRCTGLPDSNRCVYVLQVLSPARRGRSGAASTTAGDDEVALRQLFAESLEVLRTRTTTTTGGAT